MKTNIIKFYENLKKTENSKIYLYEDEKGNKSLIPTNMLVLGCTYLELEEGQYKDLKFRNVIDKDLEYNKKTITKKKDKFEITQNKKDKGTIVDTDVEVYEAWQVSNEIQLKYCFNNKEEAIAFLDKYNNEYMSTLG